MPVYTLGRKGVRFRVAGGRFEAKGLQVSWDFLVEAVVLSGYQGFGVW